MLCGVCYYILIYFILLDNQKMEGLLTAAKQLGSVTKSMVDNATLVARNPGDTNAINSVTEVCCCCCLFVVVVVLLLLLLLLFVVIVVCCYCCCCCCLLLLLFVVVVVVVVVVVDVVVVCLLSVCLMCR